MPACPILSTLLCCDTGCIARHTRWACWLRLGASWLSVVPRWWQESAHGEPISRLQPPAAWEAALANQAFVDIEICREPASANLSEGAYILLAKRPSEDAITV